MAFEKVGIDTRKWCSVSDDDEIDASRQCSRPCQFSGDDPSRDILRSSIRNQIKYMPFHAAARTNGVKNQIEAW